MSLANSPEHLVVTISKDVEQLTKTMQDTVMLFRENQAMLNRVLADMQEHKALDSKIHADFVLMQTHIVGTPSDPGLLTKVHDLEQKTGSMWKLLWAAITAAVTSGGAWAITVLK